MFVRSAHGGALGRVLRGGGGRILLLLPLSGCVESAALQVGPAAFEERALLGLAESQIDQLVAIASLGLAVARSEEDLLAAPLLARAEDALRIQRLGEAIALEEAGVDSDVLRALYSSDPDFELLVRHLVILSERWRPAAHRDAARARAEEALARIGAGAPFPEVVAAYSEEPGAAERGGLLTPGREGSWVRDFWEGAVALTPGEVSGVVESEYGFHVLRLEERRVVPFEEALPNFSARMAGFLSDPTRWARRVAGTPVDALLSQADQRGIELSAEDRDRLLREWRSRLQGWAGALGFTTGIPMEEIGPLALAALGRTDQGARLAREEIFQVAAELASAYPVLRDGY